jgi:hydrogenase maturation protease
VSARAVVVGYGNPLRGDDGAGWAVAEAAAGRWAADPGVRVLVGLQPLPEWAAELAGAELACFVDARPDDGGDPVRLEPLGAPAEGCGGAHATGAAELVALARALYGQAPACYLVSVAGHDFGHREGLSPAAAAAAEIAGRLVDRVVAGRAGPARGASPCA